MKAMKNLRRIKTLFLCFLFLNGTVFSAEVKNEKKAESKTADENSEDKKFVRLNRLMTGYLLNDLELKKLILTAQSRELDLKSAKISSGIDVSLSTGTVKIRCSDNGSTLSMTPGATVSFPQVNDSAVSASIPVTRRSGFDEISENGTFIDNGSVRLSTAIVSAAGRKRKASLEEAERAHTEAVRNVKNRVLSAEKEFYEKLKNLYSYASDVLEKKNDMHDDELDLKVLTVQGYSKNSAAYRSRALKCQSDKRNVHEAQRRLERETAVFAVKCGVEFSRIFDSEKQGDEKGEDAGDISFKAVMEFLPDSIPDVKMEDILSYEAALYTRTEETKWKKYINDLKRSNEDALELRAYGGYTFNESSSKYDTADGGLTFDWRGISASAGVSVPTGVNVLTVDGSSSGKSSKSPVYTFSVSISPDAWRLALLNRKQNRLESEIEELNISSAADDYETDVVNKLTGRRDLRWTGRSYAEEYDMYSTLAQDSEKWLQQGIITESDYRDSVNNRDKALIKMLMNSVDKIIYNNEVKLLFVAD